MKSYLTQAGLEDFAGSPLPGRGDSVNVVKNGFLYEIRKACNSDKECLENLKYFVADPSFKNCNQDSLRKKVGDVLSSAKKFKNNKQTKKLHSYLESNFMAPADKSEMMAEKLPPHQVEAAKKLASKAKVVAQQSKQFKRIVEDLEEDMASLQCENHTLEDKLRISLAVCNTISDKYREAVTSLNSDIPEMEREVNAWEEKYNSQSEKLNSIVSELNKVKEKLSSAQTRNLTKKLKRRDDKIDKLEEENKISTEKIRTLQNEKTEALSEVQTANEQVDDLMKAYCETEEQYSAEISKCNQLRAEKQGLQKKVHRLCKRLDRKDEVKVQQHREVQDEIKCYKKEIKELEGIIDVMESNEVQTFADGKYTNEVRECCMRLLTECNVSVRKLPGVINTVLHKLAGCSVTRLPSAGFLSNLYAESKIIASKQVAEAMLSGLDLSDHLGNTLHQDATSKFHEHYEGLQVTLKDGSNLSMGLKKVAGGSAADYVGAFEDAIDDLADAYKSSETEETRAKLIVSIKTFMSDQCATNAVFNSTIEKMRKDLLPGVHENYDKLSEKEKEEMESVFSFACRLHLLANFAPAADRGLAAYEAAVCSGQNPHSFEDSGSGTFRLVRTSAKALTQRGCEKSGIHSYFKTFLDGREKKNHILTYHGHRFNIVFHDAGAVFYHAGDIKDILLKWPNPNKLLKSIVFDIQEKVYLAGVRALGIVHKLSTGPLQTLLSGNTHILDVTKDLHQMQITLQQWTQDGSTAMQGEGMFPSISLNKDDVYDALFSPSGDAQLDSLTQMAIELISAEMLILLERQAATQLPGGKYWQPEETLKQAATHVPAHNMASERDMAILDNLLRIKPAATPNTIETSLMWFRNRPSIWLDSLPANERDEILNNARTGANALRKKIKERQLKLKEQLQKRYEDKRKEKDKMEEKKIESRMKSTREIQDLGGVWEVNDIPEKLQMFSNEKQKRDALWKQIRFHKNVIQAKGPRILFQETVNKMRLSTEKMQENLVQILTLNSQEVEETEVKLTYNDTNVAKDSISEKKQMLSKKIADARRQRQIKQQQTHLSDFVLDNELLVGKRISHKCRDPDTHEIEWFDGTVIGIHRKAKDPLKTYFDIRYDETPDEMWDFPVLLDFRNGDLMLKE